MLVCVIFLYSCDSNVEDSTAKSESKINVAVSIIPEETFVKEVGGDKVNVTTMIPSGQSPENYAPTTDIMEELSNSSLYFSIGVPTEDANILPKMADFNKEIKIVNIADEVSKVYSERKFASGERDPHIWLSPKRAKVMVETIAKELSSVDPNNADYYKTNSENYIEELDKLDEDIKSSLLLLKTKDFICYHPAFGYFADDYSLQMTSLENEGKEATIEDFQKTIDFAKEKGIKVIFYQAEIDSKQAKSFATEINGNAEMIEPLASDYIYNLEKIAETFKQVMEVK
jgi:zinc transport system substrate-binding protein